MTETTGQHNELIAPNADAAYDNLNYAGLADQAEIMFGPECEFFICKMENDKLVPIDVAEANAFIQYFADETGTQLHQEAIASHFELNDGPMNLENFRENFEAYFQTIKNLYDHADKQGYRVIPSSHAPHIEGADDVVDQLVDRKRIQVLVPTGREYMGDNLVKFANLTAGIHVSSGYKDTEQFYDDLRRTYYLSPFIYALSNNGFPFWQGMKDAHGVIPRLAVIEAFAQEPQGRTGIDPLFYESVDGEDFLRRYIDRTMNTPLMCFYQKGLTKDEIAEGRTDPKLRSIKELGASPEHPFTFADLEALELNTVSNMQFAASSWWYGVKVQDIPGLDGENGEPLKRLEDRIWNAGTWQTASALLVRALMTLESECGREIDDLLSEFGFRPEGPATHPESGQNLKNATRASWQNGGKYGLNFEYGEGTALEFGRKFTEILKKYAAQHGLEDYLAPMEYITTENRTDSVILHEICETPEDVKAFINHYNVETLPDPRRCFGMLLRDGQFPNPAADRKKPLDGVMHSTAPQTGFMHTLKRLFSP